MSELFQMTVTRRKTTICNGSFDLISPTVGPKSHWPCITINVTHKSSHS